MKKIILFFVIFLVLIFYFPLNTIGQSKISNEDDSFTMILNPNNPYMTVNGKKQEIDPGRGTTPVIIKEWGRTVVPIRAIVEVLGGIIEW